MKQKPIIYELPIEAPVRRTLYHTTWMTDSYGYQHSGPKNKVAKEEDANLTGSSLRDLPGYHAPVLDIDFEAQLLPSKTPGHYHLYLDRPMQWSAYRKLLEALRDAQIIEEGYADASIHDKESFARVPAGGDSLELRMAKRAFEAQQRVLELEDEIVGLKDLIAKLAARR